MEPFPITVLERSDNRFPAGLAATSGMPDRLYVRGSVDALNVTHRLAVVGTRQVTSYGEQATDILQEFGLDAEPAAVAVSTQHPIQKRIAAILESGPASVDAIALGIELPAAQTVAELSLMEVSGIIIRGDDGAYRTT